MPDARLTFAIASGKAVGIASRVLRVGGGTTLPGRIATAIEPALVSKSTQSLDQGSIIVTGTNGKTTTARLIALMLSETGLRVAHNRAGANLLSGVASAIVASARLGGRTRADIGLFEVDEAALPEVALQTRSRVVAITNLFRDQLDRYGEIDYLLGVWRDALSRLPATTTIVLNADDPAVASLADAAPGRVVFFGVDDPSVALQAREHAADSTRCVRCSTPLAYECVYYSHLGRYRCLNCGLSRPSPDVSAVGIQSLGIDGTRFILHHGEACLPVELRLPGTYNIYNSLAAATVALVAGVTAPTVVGSIRAYTAAFGRIERVRASGRELVLALVKNPVGFNQVIRMITSGDSGGVNESAPLYLAIVINDLHADGTDISWLWDVDFELLVGRVGVAITSGTRAADMALRLKYAGLDASTIVEIDDAATALSEALRRTPEGGTCYVLPTYTAMLALHSRLAAQGLSVPFWED